MVSLFNNLKTHLPFSYLSESELKLIEQNANIVYFKEESKVISTNKMPDAIYYIIKGIVEVVEGLESVDILYENDTFDGTSLLKNTLPKANYIVKEELIAYEIPKEIFLKLCSQNNNFKNYFFATIVEKIELIQKERAKEQELDTLMARVDAIRLKKVAIVEPNISVKEALELMKSQNAIALLVKNKDGYGIVTDADFREYILNSEHISTISQIQSYPIISATKDELLFNIQLLMSKNSIKHIPIIEDKEVLGVVEIADILSYFSNQTHILTSSMQNATSLESVIDIAKSLHNTIKVLHSRGIKARYIARVVSEINKKMYQKLFEFIFPKEWQENASLVLLGSEGRGEQIVRTDQDNALIFKDGYEPKDIAYYTQKFVSALDSIGYPRCSGNVMVINPKWAKSLQEYKDDIKSAIDTPNEEAMLDLAIIYDSFSVSGNKELLLELKRYLFDRVNSNKSFLAHFAKPIESFESPLGLFSRFITEPGHKDEIDIKKGAIFALIHGIRVLALEHNITKTNTTQRIKELNNIGYFNKELATSLIEALEVLNSIRLHSQLQKLQNNQEVDNYVNLKELTKIKQDSLKEAIKEVEKFKKLIIYHTKLEFI